MKRTTVIAPQFHDPVMLAKCLATGDILSRGRLTVGLGVGGRVEDYVAAGTDEVQLIPTGDDVDQVARIADLVA